MSDTLDISRKAAPGGANSERNYGSGVVGGLISAVGMGLDYVTRRADDRRQLRMQKELDDRQIAYNKEMADYNQALALDMWDKTNYSAQVEQMKKAGLNVGLMYKGAGEGGRTAGAGVGAPVNGHQAPMGTAQRGMGLQQISAAMMMQAQIDNIKADTELKRTTAAKTGGIDTELAKQNVLNAQASRVVTEWESKIKSLDYDLKSTTLQDAADKIWYEMLQSKEVLQKMQIDNYIGEATKDEAIKQMNTKGIGLLLDNQIKRSNLEINDAQLDLLKKQLEKLAQDMEMQTEHLTLDQRRTFVSERLADYAKQQTEFNTSTAAQVRQWVNLGTDVLGAWKGASQIKIEKRDMDLKEQKYWNDLDK